MQDLHGSGTNCISVHQAAVPVRTDVANPGALQGSYFPIELVKTNAGLNATTKRSVVSH